MSGHVVFQGSAPYALGTAQLARASSIGGAIEITLRIVVNGNLESVTVQIAPRVADALLASLTQAVAGEGKP